MDIHPSIINTHKHSKPIVATRLGTIKMMPNTEKSIVILLANRGINQSKNVRLFINSSGKPTLLPWN
jgi:hypothetical protein